MDELLSTLPFIPPFLVQCPIFYHLCPYVRLTYGKWALVDVERWPGIIEYNWRAKLGRGGWYAYRIETVNGRKQYIYMHRQIAHTPPDKHCHHDNGITLDNRWENLKGMPPGEHENYHKMLRISRKVT